MAIKRLNQQRAQNRSVGIIGTVKGQVVKLNQGISKNNKPYANGQILIEGAKYPTNFSIFPTNKRPDIVSDFIAMCGRSATVVLMVSPEQEDYTNAEGKTRRNTKLRVIGLPNPEDIKNLDNTLSVYGQHIEEGSGYDTKKDGSGSFLIFQLGCTQTWFNQESKTEQSRTDRFELLAYDGLADKLAEEHAETSDGAWVSGRVTIDGNKMFIKSLSIATKPSENTEEKNGVNLDAIPFGD